MEHDVITIAIDSLDGFVAFGSSEMYAPEYVMVDISDDNWQVWADLEKEALS